MSLVERLNKFWEVEEYKTAPQRVSEEEQLCEQHYFDTVGCIYVWLPFKIDLECFWGIRIIQAMHDTGAQTSSQSITEGSLHSIHEKVCETWIHVSS